jgi:hypothetical protein
MIYKIITSNSLPGIEDQVNSNIEKGWTLAGSLSTNAGYFFQPMTKLPQMMNGIMTTKEQEPVKTIKRKNQYG